ncbi:hypothetical protein DPMN_189656 [Dreissena polymorpha]|uniref:Uncharacterized protein n=1 Tax=Dreissena polymorpha TaxID=45954 RepID=A0A9D4IB13_DREPO|nr:hypothetical protein DPMN_189645 [Dreissena polymorpha]KAH3754975.1 hypothetical protein DPMN_189656 [Dreissena polymorpha]
MTPAGDSQTVFEVARQFSRPADHQTVCDVIKQSLRPEGHLQETPRQSVTVSDNLSLRRRLFGSLLQVPRWFGRLSDTACEFPPGARTVLAPSQTVW